MRARLECGREVSAGSGAGKQSRGVFGESLKIQREWISGVRSVLGHTLINVKLMMRQGARG